MLVKDDGLKRKRRLVLVRFNQGFGFNGGGSGRGGGKYDGTTARVLGNLALAIGLTYLSMTGQLGWILDAIVSIWLVAVLIPIVGVGATRNSSRHLEGDKFVKDSVTFSNQLMTFGQAFNDFYGSNEGFF